MKMIKNIINEYNKTNINQNLVILCMTHPLAVSSIVFHNRVGYNKKKKKKTCNNKCNYKNCPCNNNALI